MPGNQLPARDLDRAGQVMAALWLVSVSVAFGLLSGAVSVTAGLHGNSRTTAIVPCCWRVAGGLGAAA